MESSSNSGTIPQIGQMFHKLLTIEKERDTLKIACNTLRNKLKAANSLLLKLKQNSSIKKLEETQKELQSYTKKYHTETQALRKELETTTNEYMKLKKQINTKSKPQICSEHEEKILKLDMEVNEWKEKHNDLQQRFNKKNKMEDVAVSVKKEDYERIKKELQNLRENYSLVSDENRRLKRCENKLQSEVVNLNQLNRKDGAQNYLLMSCANERLKEREKMLEEEIENLKWQNCQVSETVQIKSNEVPKPCGLDQQNIENPQIIIPSVKKQVLDAGLDFSFSSSEDGDTENCNKSKENIDDFLDDSFSSEEEEKKNEKGSDVVIENDLVVDKYKYMEESVSPQPFGLGLIDVMVNNQQNIKKPQSIIQSIKAQSSNSGLDFSFGSNEDEHIQNCTKRKESIDNFLNDSFSSSENEEENGRDNGDSSNFNDKQDMVKRNNQREEMKNKNKKDSDVSIENEFLKDTVSPQPFEKIKKSEMITVSGLNFALSSNESESEDEQRMVKCSEKFSNAGDKCINKTPSCFSPISSLSNKRIKKQNLFDIEDEPHFNSVGDQFNVAKMECKELNSSIEEAREKLNTIKLDLIETDKQFKAIVEVERTKLDSIKKNQNKFENEMAKQQEKLNCMKMKIESVHNKLSKVIVAQEENCAKIGRLKEEQKKFVLVKLEVLEAKKKLNGIVEELQILKEENGNLKITLETVLAKNEDLCMKYHEMKSKKNDVKAEYLTIQQAAALAQKVARKEIMNHITKTNFAMKAKLKKNRSRLIEIGFKRGRRIRRRIVSEVVDPLLGEVCRKVNADGEVEKKQNGKIVETQEKSTVFGKDDESNANVEVHTKTSNALRNNEKIESVSFKSSERVIILDCQILKPIIIKDVQPSSIFENDVYLSGDGKDDSAIVDSIQDGQNIILQDYPENQDHFDIKNDDMDSLIDENCINNDWKKDEPNESYKPPHKEKLIEKTSENYVNDYFYDNQFSSDDSDSPLVIDESYVSDDDETAHLINDR